MSKSNKNKDFNHLLYMAQIVEARDPYTAGHLWRVAQFSKLLAKKLKLNSTDTFHITLGAYLHDLGKISVSDQILSKKDQLESGERLQMHSHSEMGYRALAKHELSEEISHLARHHHESWDGYGYPHQLKGTEIPYGARLLCIVDAFDAMTSTRPYRKAMPIEKAFEAIKQGSGKQFDPEMTDAFLSIDVEKLKHIIGHSDIDRALLECPACGPVVEMPEEGLTTTFCRVCTGKFDVKKDETGKTWIDFADAYGKPEDLIADPNMDHVASVFSDIQVTKKRWLPSWFKMKSPSHTASAHVR